MSNYVLEARGLTKEFRGFTAVDTVNLGVKEGTIHALIGPNGAGKTTLFNLLTKYLPITRGEIFYRGKPITLMKPAEIARLGVVRSFQISAVFPHMTVLENIRVALQRPLGTSFHFWKPEKTLNQLNNRALELLEQVGLEDYAKHVTVELPYGRKRALELATTLAMEPTVMLLDEPTQGMGLEDVDRVTELIRQAAKGRTVLMVEHNLKVVSTLCDNVTVLARGQVIAEGDYATVSANPKVKEAYIGSEEVEEETTEASA